MVKDPVCGMKVDEQNTPDETTLEYESNTYYFCSTHCKRMFESNPLEFIESGESTSDNS